jgi:pyridoxine kinase
MSNQDKRVLTVQDISCVGQCSLTVALPIISACGIETAILPSAVLSTHTAGFSGFTFRDLTEDIPGTIITESYFSDSPAYIILKAE